MISSYKMTIFFNDDDKDAKPGTRWQNWEHQHTERTPGTQTRNLFFFLLSRLLNLDSESKFTEWISFFLILGKNDNNKGKCYFVSILSKNVLFGSVLFFLLVFWWLCLFGTKWHYFKSHHYHYTILSTTTTTTAIIKTTDEPK